jgi:cytochrome c biogenesis protein CcmG, thiol:disulfide interchange protein DsbE
MRTFLPLIIFAALGVAFMLKLQLTPQADGTEATTSDRMRAAPALSGVTLSEKDTLPTPKEMEGKPYIINFYASWCVPCQAENPLLITLSQTHKVPIIGVAWKDMKVNTMKYLAQHGNPYRVVILDAQSTNAINYGIKGVPETFVIDAQGELRQHIAGPITQQHLAGILKDISPAQTVIP